VFISNIKGLQTPEYSLWRCCWTWNSLSSIVVKLSILLLWCNSQCSFFLKV